MGFPASTEHPPGWSDEVLGESPRMPHGGRGRGIPTPVGVREVSTMGNKYWDASKIKVHGRTTTAIMDVRDPILSCFLKDIKVSDIEAGPEPGRALVK